MWTKIRAWSTRNKAGCSSPVKYKHLDPILGFDLLAKKIKYTKAGNLLALDDELFAKYGKTLHTLLFGRNHWMTMDPLMIQTVAATQADKFGSAPSNRKPDGLLLGDGAFTTDGHIWKRSRELLQPVFSRSQVSQLSGLESHLQRFLERIPRDGSTIDIQPLAQGLFLDSSMEFIFGKSSGSLSPSEQCVYLFYYIDEEIKFQKQSKLPGASSKLTHGSSGYQHVLLKKLVTKYPDDKTLIRNELMNAFFAARDSVGTVTSSMLSLLARSPESWGKLTEKVAAIAPEQELTFDASTNLSCRSSLEDMLIHLYPTTWWWEVGERPYFTTTRRPNRADGDDASEFNPDRMVRLKHSWKFITFSGGRRTCPAQQNAYTDMAYFLARMVQEFKTIHNRDDCIEYVEEYVMTKSSRNGVKVAFSVK
ncbi:putative cytochrome p450 alkane hydroxylase protein [Botrytis fragariae]|uniref:Putative cytochrome p450 alkane hydroxylase protein n=1 Tax=Botrytis fragariae TaxID=1964551 RepID=A0A8H6AJT9_9HELO|nr:putative cytochrome p450 alkane hydroxylase protein [Botrytis fragariae]KAF5868573.1 putative cytochrome p450 alkane hydroxylase protein [Botrytis fragariae]